MMSTKGLRSSQAAINGREIFPEGLFALVLMTNYGLVNLADFILGSSTGADLRAENRVNEVRLMTNNIVEFHPTIIYIILMSS
jgi:hypothetical protein